SSTPASAPAARTARACQSELASRRSGSTRSPSAAPPPEPGLTPPPGCEPRPVTHKRLSARRALRYFWGTGRRSQHGGVTVAGVSGDLVDTVALLGAAVIAVPLFKRIGLGSVLGYLAAGIVVGPSVAGLFSDPEAVLHIAELGVV